MKKMLKRLLAALPMLAAGFVCGGLIGRYAASADAQGVPGGMLGALALLFIGFVAGIYLQVAVHEGGHLVFGLLSGYRFCSYRLGGMMLVREDGKLRLRRLKIAGTAGQCLMAPPPWSEDLPVLLYNLGGCLANLVTTVLCLLLWLPLRQHWLGALPLVIGLMGLAMAVTNGVPMRVGGVDNDGRNAIHLRKDRDGKYAFWLQMKIAEAQAEGLRLYQMPEVWFEYPEDRLENPLVAAVAVCACNRLMDQQRFAEARTAMEQLLARSSGMLGLHRNLLHCDLMFLRLLDGQPDSARLLLTREQTAFLRAMKTFPAVLRTQYALALLADRDEAAAKKHRAAFDRAAARYPYPAEVQSERELMELAVARAEAKL